jgi:hypothetical protein
VDGVPGTKIKMVMHRLEADRSHTTKVGGAPSTEFPRYKETQEKPVAGDSLNDEIRHVNTNTNDSYYYDTSVRANTSLRSIL